MRLWYMYVVKCSDSTLYTGVTTDIIRRIDEHNYSKKGAKYTRSRRPVTLIYKEKFANRSEACRSEYAFKQLTRKQKLSHMQNKA
jgi:putative endonuclease